MNNLSVVEINPAHGAIGLCKIQPDRSARKAFELDNVQGAEISEGSSKRRVGLPVGGLCRAANTLRNAASELAHLNRFFHEIQNAKFRSPLAVFGQRCGGDDDDANARS